MNGPTEQFNFYSSPDTMRKATDPTGQRVLPMNVTWKSKARVACVTEKQGSDHTHENLFRSEPYPQNQARTKNLV